VMAWLQYAATQRLFLTGAGVIATAARMSYASVEPQSANAADC
jgi:hypothetical protein